MSIPNDAGSSDRVRVARGAATVLLAVLSLGAARDARADEGGVIPPGREQRAQELIGDVGFMRDLGDGYRFESISLSATEVTYELSRGGHVVGRLRLRRARDAGPGDTVTPSFAVERRRLDDAPRVDAILSDATRSVTAHDDGAFYVRVDAAPVGPRGDVRKLGLGDRLQEAGLVRRLSLGFAAAAAGVLAAAALILRRLRPAWVVTDFKAIHLVPTFVSLGIFAYWGLYWRPLRAYAPLIVVQLAFAYLADAAVSLAARRRLVLGLAPIPVVLSINLFVQFGVRELFLPLAAILLAFLSKAIFRRGAEPAAYAGHVFNPSAFGVTVVAFANLLFPGLGSGDVALRFSLPPNMTEWILVLALLPQSRRPIVLVSLFALLAMVGYRAATGLPYFHPLWPPVFLSLTLLATDPSTIPRTGPGRAVFGVLLGLGFVVAATLLDRAGRSDFYGKVIPVPFANLLVPWCDRAGARLGARVERLCAPSRNRAHLAVWLAIVALGLTGRVKAGSFVPGEHEAAGTPLIQRDGEGAITCAANPVFCRPFTFAGEIAGWMARR